MEREGTMVIIDGVRYQEAEAKRRGLIPAAAKQEQAEPKQAPVKPEQKARPAAKNKARTGAESK